MVSKSPSGYNATLPTYELRNFDATTQINLLLGLLFLYTIIFASTFSSRTFVFVRLLLAPLAIVFFSKFGYGPWEATTRWIAPGLATIGLYGIMRVLDHSLISLWDSVPPYWVQREKSPGNNQSTIITHFPPRTFRQRCFYAFDLLTSQRGISWSSGIEWNWIPSRLHSWTAPPRRVFLLNCLKKFFTDYFIVDLCDTIIKTHKWQLGSPDPVTSLPMIQQFIFSVCVCIETMMGITTSYAVISALFVLCGSDPSEWPPMFDSPFLSTSLKDFWSRRWHLMFRRVFNRMSLPFVWLSNSVFGRKQSVEQAIRLSVTFGLSTLMHMFIMYRLSIRECRIAGGECTPVFWDVAIVKFFMAQPLGLIIESTVITYILDYFFPLEPIPATASRFPKPIVANDGPNESRKLVPEKHKVSKSSSSRLGDSQWKRELITRLFAWIFLIITGRWWVDKWVQLGMFHEAVMPFNVTIWRRVATWIFNDITFY